MFTNIGKKIKTLAQVIFWIELVASVITAICMFVIAFDAWDEEFYISMGFLILICGPLVSWLSVLFMYGFGELVDKTSEIERKLNPSASNSAPVQAPAANTQSAPLPDKIYQLQNLLSQNLITEEEYSKTLEKYRSGEGI